MKPELTQASELLRRNTPETIEEAIGLLQNTVFSFSMKVCGHREDAEDTMQEVLFRSLPHLAKVQDPKALAAWLYTVTRNRCRRMRRTHVQPNSAALSLDELMPDDAELGRLLLDARSGPEVNAISTEHDRFLHQAVLRIPPPLRMVLVLHDMEELSTEEVAQILDLQPGTVRVRLHRARLAVRKEMTRLLHGLPEPETKSKRTAPERPADCRALFARLSEYIDNRVEPRTCDQMRSHIEGCPACVAFLNDLKAAIDRCRTLKLSCDPAIAQRMREMMAKEYLRLIGSGDPVQKA